MDILCDYSKYKVAEFDELWYNKQNMLKCNSYMHLANNGVSCSPKVKVVL